MMRGEEGETKSVGGGEWGIERDRDRETEIFHCVLKFPNKALSVASRLKGDLKRRRSLAWKCSNCADIPNCRLRLVALSVFML